MSHVGAIPKAHQAQKVFEICSGRYEKLTKRSEHQSAFCAQKTLQTFEYCLLQRMGALGASASCLLNAALLGYIFESLDSALHFGCYDKSFDSIKKRVDIFWQSLISDEK